jgi:hypothetical protein
MNCGGVVASYCCGLSLVIMAGSGAMVASMLGNVKKAAAAWMAGTGMAGWARSQHLSRPVAPQHDQALAGLQRSGTHPP